MRGTLVAVVTAGVLDRAGSTRLATYLDMVAATVEHPIELDLRGVTAIDPHGVGLLIRLRRRFLARLAIIPSETVARTVHFVARAERNRFEGVADDASRSALLDDAVLEEGGAARAQPRDPQPRDRDRRMTEARQEGTP